MILRTLGWFMFWRIFISLNTRLASVISSWIITFLTAISLPGSGTM